MQDLKEHLERIADTPRADRPPVDVAAGAARGRRALRRRRALGGAGLAAVMAASGAVVAVQSRDTAPPPVTLAGSASNPLMQRASFGWLPPGYRVTSREEQHAYHGFGQFVAVADGPVRFEYGAITLTADFTGREPELATSPDGVLERRHRTSPVNGHRAYWAIPPGRYDPESRPVELRWEYAPRNWAVLQVSDKTVADAATVRRIAESATLTGPRPTKLPVRISGLPTELRTAPVRQVKLTDRAPVAFSMGFSGPDAAINLWTARSPSQYLSMVETGQPIVPNTRIGGRPAYVRHAVPDPMAERHPELGPGRFGGTREVLWVFGVDGFDVQLSVATKDLGVLRPCGGLLGLYRRIKVLGPDPAKWTTAPFG
ncbi:hypothetical protein [Actinomadura macrotermitis]|uniref:Uncharacterized protein n=1 Tax=Actinomadura macrotermitis TaxID=2585200 RepID=A0A7K0BU93_9ACTN|nr:hypothetical protein [Actinomadura macrotermitis]MQY04264.1 hypothetical protein [Actinomadura macrotermitis]